MKDTYTKIVQYTGNSLKSFTSEVMIIGQLNLDKCSCNQIDNLSDVKIVVTQDQGSRIKERMHNWNRLNETNSRI